MKTTTNHGLKKPDGTDLVNIDDLNYNADKLDGLLVPATTAKNGLMSSTDKTKLDGVATGANKYVHPSTHAASMITGLHKVATSGSYADLVNKPSTFPPATHSHAWVDVTGKPTTFPPATHAHAWGDVSGKPTTFPPATHAHAWGDVSGKPSTFPPASHTHTKAQISDFPTSLPANGGNADTVDGKHAGDFALASHSHSYPTTSGTLTLESGVTCTYKLKKSVCGVVTLIGSFNRTGVNFPAGNSIKIATLPSGFVPSQNFSVVSKGDAYYGTYCTIHVKTSGVIEVQCPQNTGSLANLQVMFTFVV